MDEDGNNASSYTAERHVARKHFSIELDGHECALADLLALERSEAVTTAMQHAEVDRQIESVPSMQFVTTKLATAKATKAHAENGIAADVSKAWPEAMAAVTHPIHVKASIRIVRPLQWLGGMLANLWKLKGAQSNIANHRDVTMVDQDAKVYGAHNRATTFDVVRRIVFPTALL